MTKVLCECRVGIRTQTIYSGVRKTVTLRQVLGGPWMWSRRVPRALDGCGSSEKKDFGNFHSPVRSALCTGFPFQCSPRSQHREASGRSGDVCAWVLQPRGIPLTIPDPWGADTEPRLMWVSPEGGQGE